MFTIIWHVGSHHFAAGWVDPIPYLGSGSLLALTRSHLRASTRYRAWLASRWAVWAATLASATASYYLVERPFFLRFKRRFAQRQQLAIAAQARATAV